ncbi:hypothetical protein ACLOJK_003657 [Asimina triloba]
MITTADPSRHDHRRRFQIQPPTINAFFMLIKREGSELQRRREEGASGGGSSVKKS